TWSHLGMMVPACQSRLSLRCRSTLVRATWSHLGMMVPACQSRLSLRCRSTLVRATWSHLGMMVPACQSRLSLLCRSTLVRATWSHLVIGLSFRYCWSVADLNYDAKLERFAALTGVFTPGTPVLRRDRFHGRVEQILEIINSVAQPGTHVVLYGERGVGKTSLANVLSDFLTPIWGSRRPTLRINC